VSRFAPLDLVTTANPVTMGLRPQTQQVTAPNAVQWDNHRGHRETRCEPVSSAGIGRDHNILNFQPLSREVSDSPRSERQRMLTPPVAGTAGAGFRNFCPDDRPVNDGIINML
jgi:hypothetical protein